jgi:hypothetical protein
MIVRMVPRILVGMAFAFSLCGVACGRTPVSATAPAVDVLEFLVGDASLWPRYGDTNHHQHQILDTSKVCWTKYTLPWMFECWRWDDQWVYHEVDHGIDARRWEHYIFSDGRWMPRRLTPGEIWTLDVVDNQLRWFDAECQPLPERPFPYRMRAWFEPRFDAGGDLGIRDVLVLEYQGDPGHAAPGSAERFYFARDAGWFLWTRADGARVPFNRVGGIARRPAPLCARDFVF